MRPNIWDIEEDLPQGAWKKKRELASALRELVELCVTSDAPEDVLSKVQTLVHQANDFLHEHPRRTFQEGRESCKTREDYAVFGDRSILAGHSNPCAPPMALSMEGDMAVAYATFGPVYEGLPGYVHGGLIAAAFDQLFGYLQVAHDVRSLTGSLTTRYQQPTPIGVELRFEGEIDRVDGRKNFLKARVLWEGQVTAVAEGLFVSLDSEKMKKIVEPAPFKVRRDPKVPRREDQEKLGKDG